MAEMVRQSTLDFKVRKNPEITCGPESASRQLHFNGFASIKTNLKNEIVGPDLENYNDYDKTPEKSKYNTRANKCMSVPILTQRRQLKRDAKKGSLKKFHRITTLASSSSEEEDVDEQSPEKVKLNGNEVCSTPSPKKRRSPFLASKNSDENCPSPSKCARKRLDLHDTRQLQGTSNNSLLAPIQLFNQDVSTYQASKSVLVATGENVPLPCRERELGDITSFLDEHLIGDQPKPGSLYISGPPGTGKTACLNQILQAIKFKKSGHKTVMINCMTLRAVNAIYERIYLELCPGHSRKAATAPLSSSSKLNKSSIGSMEKRLKDLLTNRERMILLILDEIDFLGSKDQEILYTIFEWPALEGSNLVLIGIANALDLTDRILPRLLAQRHTKCAPSMLRFAPYSYEQCLTILRSRLKQVSNDESKWVIKPAALHFCARKVAAVSGDIRKALDVCRRAVELVESNLRKQKILKPRVHNSANNEQTTRDENNEPGKPELNGGTVSPPPLPLATVEVGLIVSLLNEVFGSTVAKQMQCVTRKKATATATTTTTTDGLDDDRDVEDNSLPFHQKVLLCTLLLIVKQGKFKEVTVGKLHEVYCRVCKKRLLAHLEQSDFSNICSLVETRGMIGIKGNKNFRLSKVSLKVDESEIEFALQDRALLASILEDSGCCA